MADGSKPVSFKCEKCGKSFPKISGLRTHEGKWCKLRYADPTAPPYVAPVKGAGDLPPVSAEPAVPHDPDLPVTAPAAAAEAPPPPLPPAAAMRDQVQYVGRMPMPEATFQHNGEAKSALQPRTVDQWTPAGLPPTRLHELYPEQAAPAVAATPPAAKPAPGPAAQHQASAEPVTATVVPAAPWVAPVIAGQALAPPAPISVPPYPAGQPPTTTAYRVAAIDPTDVIAGATKKFMTWEGAGPLSEDETKLLRQVVVWQPGPTGSTLLVLASIFGMRILSHPAILAAGVRLIDAAVNWIEGLGKGEQSDNRQAAGAAAAPAPAVAAAPPAAPPQATQPHARTEERRQPATAAPAAEPSDAHRAPVHRPVDNRITDDDGNLKTAAVDQVTKADVEAYSDALAGIF